MQQHWPADCESKKPRKQIGYSLSFGISNYRRISGKKQHKHKLVRIKQTRGENSLLHFAERPPPQKFHFSSDEISVKPATIAKFSLSPLDGSRDPSSGDSENLRALMKWLRH